MTVRPPVWVMELARSFWATAPEPPPTFPRNLMEVLIWLPHLHVDYLPQLTLSRAAEHLLHRNVPFSFTGPDRPLRGCLAAHAGIGFILIDGADDPAQRRFTLAHELAHFLRDHDKPRRRVAGRLGPGVLSAFDGYRPPTVEERLGGVFRGVTIGCREHFLGRDDRGRPATAEARDAELAADRLAFELLAPFEMLESETVNETRIARLTGEFGLPPREARRYAAMLG